MSDPDYPASTINAIVKFNPKNDIIYAKRLKTELGVKASIFTCETSRNEIYLVCFYSTTTLTARGLLAFQTSNLEIVGNIHSPTGQNMM